MKGDFKTAQSLQNWLVEHRQVPEDVAEEVASPLFLGGYKRQSSLLNIPMELLRELKIKGPFQVTLFNTLKEPGPIPQQQQQVR